MPLPPWRPVLDGQLRADALDAVREIAGALADPVHGDSPGLSSGAGGIALMFGYVAQAETEVGVAEASDRAWMYLDIARRHLAQTTMLPTLYGGFVGLGWLHEHVERHLVDAGPADEPDPLGSIDAAVLKLAAAPPWSLPYDLISGYVGMGVFALERARSPARSALLRMVAQQVSAVAAPDGPGITWRTPGKFLAPGASPDGWFDLGVAHGIPGAVALLGELVARGVHEAEPCYRGAVAWLLSQRQPSPALSSFPIKLVPGHTASPSRFAWCYGDPGVAAALCVAAMATGDRGLLEQARQIAVRAALRDPGTSGIAEPGLCHGSIGLALCFQLLWIATADEDCATAARFWVRDALSRRTRGDCAGWFRLRLADDEATMVPEPSAGFLNGAAGVALGLLAASTAFAPAWARVMLAYPAAA